ncbi:MFS transporter [Actinomadura litoris]|uniref:MFS transporter n=1 Tax=Actinomadura litoris TaxID=2678616 RepID=UPI001FA7C5B5|nr:MFS transporter [Actinomadura litoris]
MTSPPALPASRQRMILIVLLSSSLLIWLDNTILSTAFETLADPERGIGASPAELQWVTGSYTLVFATLMFTAGALGDRFGHRTVLATGIAVFGAASVWAAYAGGAGGLIAARAAMGVGGALIMPATMAIMMWTFSGAARATAIGLFSSSAGVGIAAGPLLAGLLLERFWWGSVFLVNVPVTVLALAGILALVPNFRSPERRPLDLPGLALSISGLAFLAYGLIRAGQVASWSPVDVWAPILTGLVLLAAFVVVELRARQPGFDPRLLAERVFGGGNAALGMLMFAMTAGGFYGAFYLQGARGFSPLEAGLAICPVAAGLMVGAPLAVRLVSRYSLRPVAVPALAVSALAMGSAALFGLHTSLVWIELVYLVQGLAIGMVIGPVTTELMSTLPLERAGAGSAVTNTVRQTGSVLGIAAGGTIMSIAYRGAIEPSLRDVPGTAGEQARVSAEQARHVAAAIDRPDLVGEANDAFIHAMHVGSGWTMLIAFSGVALLMVALRPVRRTVRPDAADVGETAAPVTTPAGG